MSLLQVEKGCLFTPKFDLDFLPVLEAAIRGTSSLTTRRHVHAPNGYLHLGTRHDARVKPVSCAAELGERAPLCTYRQCPGLKARYRDLLVIHSSIECWWFKPIMRTVAAGPTHQHQSHFSESSSQGA